MHISKYTTIKKLHEIMGWLMVVGSRDALFRRSVRQGIRKDKLHGVVFVSIYIEPARDRSSPKPPDFGSLIRCMKYDVCTVLKSPVEILPSHSATRPQKDP